MNTLWMTFCIVTCMQIFQLSALPFTDDDGDNFSSSESDTDARRRHKNKRKPCQKSNEERTFFQLSYVDVNYNYNCGNNNGAPHEGVSSHNNQRPSKRPHHNHNRPPHNNNNVGNEEPVQQNEDAEFSTTRRPHRPLGNFLANHNGAFIQSFFNNLFANNQKEESKPIPVHEDIKDNETTKYEPGLYVAGYNPITGQYLQSNITNPKRIYRKISKGIDYFISPLYDLI